MVERAAKDLSGDSSRGTLKAPGLWRTESRNDGIGVHYEAVKTFPECGGFISVGSGVHGGTAYGIFGSDATNLHTLQPPPAGRY
jgi:hypothetical protein